MQNNLVQQFQTKLQSTVKDLNANITDGASRLRQQIVQNTPASLLSATSMATQQSNAANSSPSPSPSKSNDGFIRLPIESAKKLRWYDQHDIKMLIQLHLREKHELQQANIMLREALDKYGGGTRPEIVAVNAAVDKIKAEDDALNEILVVASQAEVEKLQSQVGQLMTELKSIKQARQELEKKSHYQEQDPTTIADTATTTTTEMSNTSDESNNDNGNTVSTEMQSEPGEQGPKDSCSHCTALEQQTARLSSALAEISLARDVAVDQLESLQKKYVEVQQAQIELLRVAQDERLQAESRYEEAQALATKETKRADQEAAECKLYKQRAEKAEAELKKEKSDHAAKADASAAHQRARALELEMATSTLSHQLAAAQSQILTLESRLGAAEDEATRANADARSLEVVAAERDELYARLSAAESKLKESRAVELSGTTLKEMLQQSEIKRRAAEEELITTAKLAAELEERLVQATSNAEQAILEAQKAALNSKAAWDSVDVVVEQRWIDAGKDRSKWPTVALDEIEAIEARLSASLSTQRSLQERLEQAERKVAEAVKHAEMYKQKAQDTLANVEQSIQSFEQRERRLEAAALAASRQVDEFRAALSRLERERDQLAEEKKDWESASKKIAEAKIIAGSGSINDGNLGDGMPPSTIKEHRTYLTPAPRAGNDIGLLNATDLLYLRNVLLKFLNAHMEGKKQECDVLLPALAAVVRATPAEFHKLEQVHSKSHAWL